MGNCFKNEQLLRLLALFPGRKSLSKSVSTLKRKNIPQEDSIHTENGQNENGRVTSTESVSIHLTSDCYVGMSHDLQLRYQVVLAVGFVILDK